MEKGGIPLFGKPLNAITAADIQCLADEKIRESDVVEFKEALPGRDGPDAWHQGADRVGETARNKIAAEIIAFANGHGGTLVIGVAETKDKPPRADTIVPVRACAELAGRLVHMLRDVIEPPLAPFPVVHPVETAGRDGVVVIEVAASRNAPHRNTSTLDSYIRRGEHTQRMTMREIQDLTLQVERGLVLLERQFNASATRFETMCRPSTAMAMRATAVPLSKLSVPIPHDKAIVPQTHVFSAVAGTADVRLVLPHAPLNFRPILRGLRASEKDNVSGSDVSIEVSESGTLEIFFIRRERNVVSQGSEEPNIIFLPWFLGMACNAIMMADYLRNAGGAPGTEYGLELAVYDGGSLQAAFRARHYGLQRWLAGTVILPRYSIGDRSGFQAIVELIERDFWSATGTRHTDPPMNVDFG